MRFYFTARLIQFEVYSILRYALHAGERKMSTRCCYVRSCKKSFSYYFRPSPTSTSAPASVEGSRLSDRRRWRYSRLFSPPARPPQQEPALWRRHRRSRQEEQAEEAGGRGGAVAAAATDPAEAAAATETDSEAQGRAETAAAPAAARRAPSPSATETGNLSFLL